MHEHKFNDNGSADADRLRLAVVDAISRSEPIRAIGLDTIQVEVKHRTAILSGRVPTVSLSFVAGRLAASVGGIEGVENHLAIDEEIEGKIALALAANEATMHLRISIRVSDNCATLYGAVDDETVAATATSVATTAADGLEVRSNLRVVPPGSHAILLWQNSLEGRQMVERPAPAEAATEPESPADGGASPTASPIGGMA